MKTRILTVGRLVPRKGHPYLIKAVKQLVDEGRDIRLVIVGWGPDKEILLKLAEGIDFEIKSGLSEADVDAEYQKADIFVLPSITDDQNEKEGLGMVMIEAMSFDLPIVAYSNGGVVEVIINEESGLLVEEKDVDGLAAAMKKLIDDPEYREQLVKKALKRTKEIFSTQKLARQQAELYDKILAST